MKLVGRCRLAVALAIPLVLAAGLAPPAAADTPGQMVLYDTTAIPSQTAAIGVGQSKVQVEKALGADAGLSAQARSSSAGPPAGVDAASLPAPTETYDPAVDTSKTYVFRSPSTASKRAANATTQSLPASSAQAQGALDFNSCRNNPKGGVGNGIILNHYNYCVWSKYTGVIYDSKGVSRGTIQFTRITIGEAKNGTRTVLVSTALREFQFSGSINSQVQLTMNLAIGGYNGGVAPNGNPAPTIVNGSQSSTMTAGLWSQNFVLQELVTDPSTGLGRDKISRGTFRPDIWSYMPGVGAASNWVTGQVGGSRWDSAPYLYQKQGAIFDRVLPNMTYSKSNSLVGDVARHIESAFQNPNATFPPKSGNKVIPGNIYTFQTTGVLHRSVPAYAPAVYSANRSAKDKACKQIPAATDTNCDEYPFASTREGAGLGDGNYSIRRVNDKQNQKAGSDLNVWFGSDRILHDDAFVVRIVS